MEYILCSLGGDRSLPYSCYSVSSIRTFMHTAPCRNWVYLWSAFSLPLLPVVLEIPPSAPQSPFPVDFSSTSWLFQHFRRLCLSSIISISQPLKSCPFRIHSSKKMSASGE
jgi:hypothetical protein